MVRLSRLGMKGKQEFFKYKRKNGRKGTYRGRQHGLGLKSVAEKILGPDKKFTSPTTS